MRESARGWQAATAPEAKSNDQSPMISWLWTSIEANRARNAAVTAIRPLVEESRLRLDGISDSVWLEPYMVGFLTMLITIAAKYKMRGLGDRAMCKVQAAAWQAITGLDYQVGEEIILLSEAHDQQFAAGCSDAMTVAAELYRARFVMPDAADDGNFSSYSRLDDAIANASVPQTAGSARWLEVFDGYVTRHR